MRDRPDLRGRLLDAALEEFPAHGFDGASTRAIAQRIGAHQPQIDHRFESKEALWRAAIGRLFDRLVVRLDLGALGSIQGAALPAEFANPLRRFVQFAAEHPEFNGIMVHAATAPGPRLAWMTERHVQPCFAGLQPVWRRFVDAGIAASIEARLIHHVLVGAASHLFITAAEFELLTGDDPTRAVWVERHADGLIAMLLPGLRRRRRRSERSRRVIHARRS